MILGSTPACPHDTMRASGFLPSWAASLAVISTTAAAPSLMPEALPAVTLNCRPSAGAMTGRVLRDEEALHALLMNAPFALAIAFNTGAGILTFPGSERLVNRMRRRAQFSTLQCPQLIRYILQEASI